MAKMYGSGVFSSEQNEAMDKAVEKALKGTKIAEGLAEEETEEVKYQIFDSCIIDTCYAAKEMYCEDGKSLDEVLEVLMQAFTKLKGKEADFKKAFEEEENEESDEDEAKEEN